MAAGDEVDGAGGGGEGDGAGDAVERKKGLAGGGGLFEACGEDDGEVVALGEVGQGGQDGMGAIDEAIGIAEEGGDGIDDDEGEVGNGPDGGFQGGERIVGVRLGNEGGEAGEKMDVGKVRTEGVEAGADGVGGVVFGGKQ